MKRIGIVGSGLVGALAASAILASTAVAVPYSISALPQLGRCVKVAEGTGEWMGKHCGVIAAPGTGSYNFEQGPGATPGFEGVLEGLTVGEPVKLETKSPTHLITCSNSAVKGEYTGAKSEKVKVELLGCLLSGKICTGEAGFQEGEIHFSAESSTLGFVKTGKKAVAGWDWNPISVAITCGRPPETEITQDELAGSVIGKVIKPNSMYLEFLERYVAVEGKQRPEKLVREGEDVLKSKFTELPSFTQSEEQTGLVARDLIENKEPLEIKTKCVKEGAPCP